MMETIRYILFVTLLQVGVTGSAQFLSTLKAVKSDALYTTYAAPSARTHYKTDQGYQFQWFDDGSGVEFISKDGPNLGIAFKTGDRLIFKLAELYREPVVTSSYSDLVRYFYYPVKDFRVEVFFAVYSSETAIVQYRFVNEGLIPLSFSALPYLYYPYADSLLKIEHQPYPDGFAFSLLKKRDGWMQEHNIPLADTLTGFYMQTGCSALTGRVFVRSTEKNARQTDDDQYKQLIESMNLQKRSSKYVNGIISSRSFTLQPGDATSFRVAADLVNKGSGRQGSLHTSRKVAGKEVQKLSEPGNLDKFDLENLVKEDEQAYANIPKLSFTNRNQEMLYWSAFSLMRQCMMPPEAACRHNYYVFSREPRWGWGYGGQVFHESLVMLAYAYMDPMGAMNSQRVFMDRQQPGGYINYRTGPYLDETIETNGKPTSSAPWFNYENLEIYKITGDVRFLKKAYASGKKFYQYYVANRDSNNNGLCEWGAHAELESVRDARVAVWDKVGWAANFEGPDVNSMLVKEAGSLSEMAKQLGLAEESKQWQDDARRRSDLINKTMWDPETNFYYNVTKNDHSFTFQSPNDLKIKEIIGFLPLWSGGADAEKAKLLVAKMQDPAEFWRPFGVPSLTAADSYYCPIGYWNGPVWVQWEYLLYRGLRDYGYGEVAGTLANRVLDNMIFHLKSDHTFWEFYSADDHQAGWNKTYIWAGIAARFLIDEHSNH
ncbi:MAG: trehalase family glycosidase [Bacteroidetes bacterium]|nr:trehalase family glycosidase [Bacteroidota bacterium]